MSSAVEIQDQVASGAGREDEDIAPGSALEDIVAKAAIDRLLAGAAGDDVVAGISYGVAPAAGNRKVLDVGRERVAHPGADRIDAFARLLEALFLAE